MNFENGTIASHNGKITIASPTGNHRTFSIKTQKVDSNFAPGKRVVALLNGPDNQSDYCGFGFISNNGQDINVWKKKQGGIFDQYAKMLLNPDKYQELGAEYLFSGTCRMCNRELTVPSSIESGIGPICAKK